MHTTRKRYRTYNYWFLEHCIAFGCVLMFSHTELLSIPMQEFCWNRIFEEAIFIYFEPNTVNRDSGLKFHNGWRQLLLF